MRVSLIRGVTPFRVGAGGGSFMGDRGARLALLPLAAFLLGILAGAYYPSQDVYSSVQEKFSSVVSLPPFTQSLAVFVNNVAVAAELLAGSVLVVPGLALLSANGYVLGMYAHMFNSAYGLSGVALMLALLAPHGVFELTAHIYASILGIRFAAGIARRGVDPWRAAARVLAGFATVIVLLLVAAFIEVYVSERLAGMLSKL